MDEVSLSTMPNAFFANPINFFSVVISALANALLENTFDLMLKGAMLEGNSITFGT